MTYHQTRMTSPVGELTLLASDAGLCAVMWENEKENRVWKPDSVKNTAHAVLKLAKGQLEEYFANDRTTFDVPLDLHGTEFQVEVWNALASIPFGKTISYATQAQRLGRPQAMRAVGAANGRNPISIILPCHRVVGSNGSLTGFAAGIDTKKWLLDHEKGHTKLAL